MKKLPLILLLFATVSLHAQRVRPMQRPPASATPHGIARQSTALSAASHVTRPPLAALPAFSVTDRDGHLVPSASFARTSHWLLLYSRQNCIPCDKLLMSLSSNENPASKRGAPYVIVVDAPTVDALERVRAAYPYLSDATWVADTGHEASTALKLKGSPMLYALHGNAIAFHVPGTLGDALTVKNLANSWLTTNDNPARTGPSAPVADAAGLPSGKP